MLKKNKELPTEELHTIADKKKREFIKKFGSYAISAPSGMFLLMSLGTSKAHASSDLEDSSTSETTSEATSTATGGSSSPF